MAYLKEDVYRAVQEFLQTGKLLKQVNCTAIILISKVANPSSVQQYRPIACCTVLYKIISKILTRRMQAVIGEVVDQTQSCFIPERVLADNILLATGLIKGYTRRHLSRMLKIDLKKAYDSLEWPFLRFVLLNLGFPLVFVDWVMNCVSSVSYLILINGYPSKAFPDKKRA